MKDDGSLVTEGDLLINPKLATTFRKIVADPMTFYTGDMAWDIVDDIAEYGLFYDKYFSCLKLNVNLLI